MVKVGEVRAILVEVISFRPEVIVDHIQTHGEAFGMRDIDEFLQISDAAVAVLKRERENAVISPVSPSGELGQRHQFDGRYAKICQFVEVRYEGGNRTFGRKRSHVQFVK